MWPVGEGAEGCSGAKREARIEVGEGVAVGGLVEAGERVRRAGEGVGWEE